ncbi:MAG: YaaR family protein [Spirochaetia bacterium]|nr:YaaR family protein [Spirochaetia bacterium]
MAKINTFAPSFMGGGTQVENYAGSEKTEKSEPAEESRESFFSRIKRNGFSDTGSRQDRNFSGSPEEWERMRGKITALGKEVVNTRSPEVIREYKSQIKKLMEAVIAASLHEREVRFTRRVRGSMPRQEVLRLVEVIDSKLNQLTVDLMDEQSRPIRILGRINEIEGLIVDLLS